MYFTADVNSLEAGNKKKERKKLLLFNLPILFWGFIDNFFLS